MLGRSAFAELPTASGVRCLDAPPDPPTGLKLSEPETKRLVLEFDVQPDIGGKCAAPSLSACVGA